METKTILIAMVAVFALACSKEDNPAPGPVEKSGEKQMVSFVFRAGDNAALQTDVFAILNDSAKTATASLPHGTDVKALLPDITVSEKASVVPKGAKDFTDPVTYIVTAEDGSEAIYKASANTAPSDKKQLWDFRFLASKNNALVQDVVAEIDQGKKTVAAKMPAGTEITALEPSVDIPSGAIQEPEGPQDFTEPVRYTITAADGSSSTYTVTLTVPLTEKDILLKIIAINPQLNFRSWTAENNISDFRGVEVDNNGRVNELVIRNNGLETLPPEIGELTQLETLELGGQLTSLPPEIGQLVHLKYVQLYSNILSSIPTEIGRLTSLEYLELSDNVLTLLPSGIGQLTQLQFLGLDKNDISEFPRVVGQLKNLKELRLSHNKIPTLPPEIGLMTGLEELWLVDNVLSGLPVEIGQLSKLEELNLGDNSLETLPPEIWQLTLLQKLVVNDNRITSLPPEIEQLIRLQRLDFRNNSLTTLPPEIGQLTNLQFLSLADNRLRSVPSEMGRLTNLNSLLLDANNDLTAIPDEVCSLERDGTTEIDIYPLSVTCE